MPKDQSDGWLRHLLLGYLAFVVALPILLSLSLSGLFLFRPARHLLVLGDVPPQPAALIAILFSLIPTGIAYLVPVLFLRRWTRHNPETRLLRGCCPACGYDLRATPDRCPECGTSTCDQWSR